MATLIIDLLKNGSLQAGDVLVWHSRVQGISHKAHVLAGGAIQTADGTVHKSPSGALKHLNGQKPVDGWMAWKLVRTGEALFKIRDR
jgi:hypothetical protein